MAPPLTISDDEVDLAMEILDESLAAVTGPQRQGQPF
jgi:4-aminobutyrate aminotransferase-like enzyme